MKRIAISMSYVNSVQCIYLLSSPILCPKDGLCMILSDKCVSTISPITSSNLQMKIIRNSFFLFQIGKKNKLKRSNLINQQEKYVTIQLVCNIGNN